MESKHKGGVMGIFKCKNAEVHMEQGPIGRTLLMFAALILSVIINFFVGFSTGVSAVTAAAFGGFQYQKLSRILHAVVLMSLISGAVMTVAGIGCSGIFLQWIHCPEEVFSTAQYYLRICMMGIIPQFIYNMGNAILRALGNTREPLYFLTFSSGLNLVLDVLFVIGLGMGLPGAGVATVISQWVLAMLMIWKMIRLDVRYNLQITRLFGGLEELPEIINTGLPSGMQAVFMSIYSLLIQDSINSFGADAAAGMVVFARVEGFLYYPAFSYGMALTGFIGQNYGAGKMDRVQEGMKKKYSYPECLHSSSRRNSYAGSAGNSEVVYIRSGNTQKRTAGHFVYLSVLFFICNQSGIYRRIKRAGAHRISYAVFSSLLLYFSGGMVSDPPFAVLGYSSDLFQL